MKVVYFCTGGCEGESDVAGVCQATDCPRHGKALTQSYKCEECELHYADAQTAQKCEAWCKKYKACNIEIEKLSFESQK